MLCVSAEYTVPGAAVVLFPSIENVFGVKRVKYIVSSYCKIFPKTNLLNIIIAQ